MKMERVSVLSAAAAFAGLMGCSSGSNAGAPIVGADAGGADAGATTAEGDAGPNVDPAATLSAGIGPIDLAASEETTVCIVTEIDNADALYVTRIVADLAPGSHHLIVYQEPDSTALSATPTPCRPFAGITSGEKPMMIVERPHDDLVFPENVALKFEAHQKVKLEAHYINTTATPLEGSGKVQFEGLPPAQAANLIESNLAFWGPTSFTLPPHAVTDSKMQFQTAIAGTKGFALTTHQHHLGTHVRVWSSAAAGDTSAAPLADTTNWAEPPLYRLSPELSFDGTNGLSFQCEWNNTTNAAVSFGESANNEMCFIWMYYYPSHGFDICFDGRCPGRN